MKSITSYILIFVFTLPLIVNVAAIGDYLLRFQYYKNVLCENKSRPESTCLGTCQLKDKFQNSEKTQEPVLSGLVSFSVDALLELFDVYQPDTGKFETLSKYPDVCCSFCTAFGKVPTPPPEV